MLGILMLALEENLALGHCRSVGMGYIALNL